MDFEEIGGLISGKAPSWIPGHLDHFHTIPGTKSYVFYPYDFSAEDEESLSDLCSAYWYTVVKRPREESEYHPDSHKILILEPGYNDERVEYGCGLIAKRWRIYKARGEAGTLDMSPVCELIDAFVEALKGGHSPTHGQHGDNCRQSPMSTGRGGRGTDFRLGLS